MAQLIVRNIDDEVVRRLKVRAAEKGRSAEAEHREILRQALGSSSHDNSIKALLRDMPDVGDDDDFARARDVGRKVEL